MRGRTEVERGKERDGGLNDGAQCDRMDTSITVHTHRDENRDEKSTGP